MSNLERDPTAGGAAVAEPGAPGAIPAREVPLGRYTTVRRYLPYRTLRTVGAWCFLDHFGPDSVINMPGMRVPPHPHTGLQTVSWLLDGEILHRDSLGSVQTIRPGQLNLMTSGRGIAHSEESPADRPPSLHGLQLWIALPDGVRHGEPGFEHHADLPVLTRDGLTATVLVGDLAGARSPARVHSPLVGAELALSAGATVDVPVRPEWEYALLPIGQPSTLRYLGGGRESVRLTAGDDERWFLLGGEPFAESLVMWWNFVGRSHDDIAAARADWADGAGGDRFGAVRGYDGDPLPAPPLPGTRLMPRDRLGRSPA